MLLCTRPPPTKNLGTPLFQQRTYPNGTSIGCLNATVKNAAPDCCPHWFVSPHQEEAFHDTTEDRQQNKRRALTHHHTAGCTSILTRPDTKYLLQTPSQAKNSLPTFAIRNSLKRRSTSALPVKLSLGGSTVIQFGSAWCCGARILASESCGWQRRCFGLVVISN